MANKITFIEWLKSEMEARDLSQADLARLSGVTRSAINGILTGQRGFGIDLIWAISKGLQLPTEFVYRKAGLLPPEPEESPTLEEANYLLNQLTVEEQKMVIGFMRVIAERREKYNAKPRNKLEKSHQY